MTSAQETFRKLIKRAGHSVTQPRLVVFNALLGQEPLSMHELVQRARGVDRASVYRAIDLFGRLGIVQRLNTVWKYKLELSDQFAEHHHHLTCMRCGRTVPMNEQELEEFIGQLARRHSFMLKSHQIEIQGICQHCQESRAAEEEA